MTKKFLKWRLKELPTVNEVTVLVNAKIIAPAEARDLLFKEENTVAATPNVQYVINGKNNS